MPRFSLEFAGLQLLSRLSLFLAETQTLPRPAHGELAAPAAPLGTPMKGSGSFSGLAIGDALLIHFFLQLNTELCPPIVISVY